MSRTNDRTYQLNRARLRAQPNLVCVVCGQPIDVDLPQYHPLAFHADHVDPVGLGGDNRGALQATHRQCNQRRGTKNLDAVRVARHSRQHY